MGYLQLTESDVTAMNETVSLNGIVCGEIVDVAAVNGGLVGSQVEVVSKIEQMIWCSHGFNRIWR